MSIKNYLLTIYIFLIQFGIGNSQTVRDLSVEVYATVQNSPPQIKLTWVANSGTTSYKIYRKNKDDITWGSSIVTLVGTTTEYIDFNVAVGASYEYKIERFRNNGIKGYGYILSGIDVPLNDNRGIFELIVDNTFSTSLASELNQLTKDLEGDGWQVIQHNVSRNASVTSIKSLLINDYSINNGNVKAVLLFGHVPVPYSGEIYPDGHPDHQGAWPADVYYGDMNGEWTDIYVNNELGSSTKNKNIPNDGKFDQSYIPSDIELQIGRVDLFGLTFFSQSEETLLRNYLNKNHQYKTRIINAMNQALIDDNFGYFNGEAFSASAYKSFAPTELAAE
jgi:hypothetical protein